MKIDRFAFDGLTELLEQIENIRATFNSALTFKGCLITMYQQNIVNISGVDWLKKNTAEDLVFTTHIRNTVKVGESTFVKKPLLEYAPKCTAARDYEAFADEYLNCARN
jgi:chromosome partitioning protein